MNLLTPHEMELVRGSVNARINSVEIELRKYPKSPHVENRKKEKANLESLLEKLMSCKEILITT